MNEYDVELLDIRKKAPAGWLLDGASLRLKRGEIHGLLGDHGAGKSALLRVMIGACRADGGCMRCGGSSLKAGRGLPGAGCAFGVSGWVAGFTVLQNILAGDGRGKLGLIREKKARAALEAWKSQFGIGVDPDAMTGDLPAEQLLEAAILKMLFLEKEILLFDDPISLLPSRRKEGFLRLLRRLADSGKMLLITGCRPEDMLDAADICTVLRQGKTVEQVNPKESGWEEMYRLMTGESGPRPVEKKEIAPGSVVLEVRDMQVKEPRGKGMAVRSASFEVRAGEIVCLIGCEGAGQTACAEAVLGLRPMVRGRVRLNGRNLTGESAREHLRAGVSYLPGREGGLIPEAAIRDNLVLHRYWDRAMQDSGVVCGRAVREYAEDVLEEHEIERDGSAPARTLGRGERQRLIAARAVDRVKDLLLAVQPAYGADQETAWEIGTQIVSVRDSRKAVLLISEDPREAMALADRILVMCGGEIAVELDPALTTAEEIALHMVNGLRQEKFGGRMEEENE